MHNRLIEMLFYINIYIWLVDFHQPKQTKNKKRVWTQQIKSRARETLEWMANTQPVCPLAPLLRTAKAVSFPDIFSFHCFHQDLFILLFIFSYHTTTLWDLGPCAHEKLVCSLDWTVLILGPRHRLFICFKM